MFIFYNAHPKGLRVGDCVKRSISKVQDMPYNEVTNSLNALKRKLGAKEFNDKIVTDNWLKIYNYERIKVPVVKGFNRVTVGDFSDLHPTGRYILRAAGHWVACVDGDIYDTWDCTQKCCYVAFKFSD